MKKALSVFLFLALAGTAALAASEAPASKVVLGLGAGVAMPLNSGLSDNYGSAFHIGATVNIVLQPNLWLFFDGRVHSMSIKSGAYPSDFPSNANLTGGGASILSVIGGAKYFLTASGPLRFYVFGGIGFNSESYKDVTGSWTNVTPYYTQMVSRTISFESQGGFGILLGPGLSYSLGEKFSVYAELRYASDIGKTMYLPLLVGMQIGL